MAWNAILKKKLIFYKSIMNMFRKIVTICLVAFLYVTADAQDFYDEFRAKSIDVEGVKIDQKMTYGQFVAKLGKPDRYKQDKSEGDGYSYLDEYYWVGKNSFSFINNGTFNEFFLMDDRFAALTLWIPGGVRVGDKLSKLDNFKYGKPKVASWLKPEDGLVDYVLFYDYLDDLVFLSVKDGVIQNIHYSSSM